MGVIEDYTLPLYECPEHRLPKLPGEDKNLLNARRSLRYRSTKKAYIESFTNDLIAQWPAANIYTPTNPGHDTYIKTIQVTEATRACF
jgi:hypothetical protein